MTAAIASVVSRSTGISIDLETLRIVLFCGLGLTVSLLLISHGFDLSAGLS